MAYVGKEYKHEKDENFEEFVASLGIPDDKAQLLLNYKPSQKLIKEGDEYILSSSGSSGPKELKFQDGVEFDEEIAEGVVAKTIFKVNGDEVVQEQTFADGRVLTYKREYSPDKLIVTLTASFWDGSAVRHYVAE